VPPGWPTPGDKASKAMPLAWDDLTIMEGVMSDQKALQATRQKQKTRAALRRKELELQRLDEEIARRTAPHKGNQDHPPDSSSHSSTMQAAVQALFLRLCDGEPENLMSLEGLSELGQLAAKHWTQEENQRLMASVANQERPPGDVAEVVPPPGSIGLQHFDRFLRELMSCVFNQLDQRRRGHLSEEDMAIAALALGIVQEETVAPLSRGYPAAQSEGGSRVEATLERFTTWVLRTCSTRCIDGSEELKSLGRLMEAAATHFLSRTQPDGRRDAQTTLFPGGTQTPSPGETPEVSQLHDLSAEATVPQRRMTGMQARQRRHTERSFQHRHRASCWLGHGNPERLLCTRPDA